MSRGDVSQSPRLPPANVCNNDENRTVRTVQFTDITDTRDRELFSCSDKLSDGPVPF